MHYCAITANTVDVATDKDVFEFVYNYLNWRNNEKDCHCHHFIPISIPISTMNQRPFPIPMGFPQWRRNVSQWEPSHFQKWNGFHVILPTRAVPLFTRMKCLACLLVCLYLISIALLHWCTRYTDIVGREGIPHSYTENYMPGDHCIYTAIQQR